jgi:phospholipid N-methyltransferase
MHPVLLARAAAAVSATHWRRYEGRFSDKDIDNAVQSLPDLAGFPKKALAKWINTVLQRLGSEDAHAGA